MNVQYADIIIPLSVRGTFTYHIPEDMAGRLSPGMIVVVQFGKQKFYSGVVKNIHSQANTKGQIKDISFIQEDTPLINKYQLRLWEWISSYYMCSPGEVYMAAIPSGYRLESETRFLPGDSHPSPGELTEHQQNILDAVSGGKSNTLGKLKRLFPQSSLVLDIRSLLTKGFLEKEEKIKGKGTRKNVTTVRLAIDTGDREGIASLLATMKNSVAKARIISAYLEIASAGNNMAEVERSVLLKTAGASASVLREMVKQGIFKAGNYISAFDATPEIMVENPACLTPAQETVLADIKRHFETGEVVLLHGVTSSGKTEIYIHLIREMLDKGRQILFLMPEIALTAQMVMRLRLIFGKKVAVYHSKYTDKERIQLWNDLVSAEKSEEEKPQIVIGARSAVFLPFTNLGLIIVDEEHENSYKQFDPAPRYNARDTAIVLAGFHNAGVLLGTATPSVETYYNCITGKYSLVELGERYLDIKLPEIVIVNTREARRKKAMFSHFSDLLVENISTAIENGEQVILFQNRRGYARYLECSKCGYIPVCKKCNVTLTYHRAGKGMQCHYCGYTTTTPTVCPVCGAGNMSMKGFGTEQIEDEVPLLFPGARTARLDYDTTRNRESYESILQGFANRDFDILIGTQMVSKGLHFDHVKVVGVMSADTLLNFPDFRSFERSFQQLAQVSGRAGRKNGRGKVIIQTSDDNHPVLKFVKTNDYKTFYNEQIAERRLFRYPPFSRLIRITLKHRDCDVLDEVCGKLATLLKEFLGERLIGPEYPLVDRIKGYYLKELLIKAAKDSSLQEIKKRIREETFGILKIPAYRSVQAGIDVDPY